MKERFNDWKPGTRKTRKMLEMADQVIEEYQAEGYDLTVRQLYYQMVARDFIPNNDREYKKLISLLTNARMGGHIDWSAIVDRGRNPAKPPEWDSPASIVAAAAEQYRVDRWAGQERYVEVWCEKDALSSVLEPVCDRMHVVFMANRGYSSSTALYDAGKRFKGKIDRDIWPALLYLGDHDPSGMDMTRDVKDRVGAFAGELGIEVRRLALNYDQIIEYAPPPNPAKLSDSRAGAYIAEYGPESWELDALEPQVLDDLVSAAILDLRDDEKYNEQMEREEAHRDMIRRAADGLRSGT